MLGFLCFLCFLFGGVVGLFIAAILASDGMVSRDQERIAGQRVPTATIKEKL